MLICLQGGKEYLMRAHFGLPSVESEDTEGKPPIQVKFEIPYFTTSGIQVSVHPLYFSLVINSQFGKFERIIYNPVYQKQFDQYGSNLKKKHSA
jgi:HSP20 family molecular chaperone IbpA